VTDAEIIGASIAGAGLLATIIGMAVKTTRAITRSEVEIRTDFDAQIDNLQRDIAHLEKSAKDRSDLMTREFGETVSAIRQKVHDVEMFTRDTFVRKDSFELVVGRLEKSIEKLGDKIEDKLERFVERFQKAD
jgi:hypothetical protein